MLEHDIEDRRHTSEIGDASSLGGGASERNVTPAFDEEENKTKPTAWNVRRG